MTKDQNTEQKIKEAATDIFMEKGLTGARMQEIADAAGINKALLHYYYRSKDKLFQAIFNDVIQEFAPKVLGALGSNLPLREKIERYVEEFINLLKSRPFMPVFIFHEMKNHPKALVDKVGILKSGAIPVLAKQLETEAEAGNIKPIAVQDFMINLVSLCVFPIMAKPMFQHVFSIEDQDFMKFLETRKNTIPDFIMSAIS